MALSDFAWYPNVSSLDLRVIVYVVNGSRRGSSYPGARGEICRPSGDDQMRKQRPTMFPSIRNESWGIEYDQIP
jgi:hypothetical protein